MSFSYNPETRRYYISGIRVPAWLWNYLLDRWEWRTRWHWRWRRLLDKFNPHKGDTT